MTLTMCLEKCLAQERPKQMFVEQIKLSEPLYPFCFQCEDGEDAYVFREIKYCGFE